jgi:hypothetical protein
VSTIDANGMLGCAIRVERLNRTHQAPHRPSVNTTNFTAGSLPLSHYGRITTGWEGQSPRIPGPKAQYRPFTGNHNELLVLI